MPIKRITAIVPIAVVERLESNLRACGVPGVTVEHVKGYGEHPNYFRRNLMQDNARVVLYVDSQDVQRVIDAIVGCAQECGAQAGILAVESIDRLVSLTDGAEIVPATN